MMPGSGGWLKLGLWGRSGSRGRKGVDIVDRTGAGGWQRNWGQGNGEGMRATWKALRVRRCGEGTAPTEGAERVGWGGLFVVAFGRWVWWDAVENVIAL